MAVLGGYYVEPHKTQYGTASARTHEQGCTWTTAANGAMASTGGRVNHTPDQIVALIPRAEETDPSTPGWSLQDVDHAMAKIGVGYEVRSGQGWAAVIAALNSGLYVELQGDSDQFGNNTCSGAFNGDHAVGVHPARRVVGGLAQRWIDDPICPTGRWEYEHVLRSYAQKLNTGVRFAVFTHAVPKATVTASIPPKVILRPGARAITPVTKTIRVGAGHSANVRNAPSTHSSTIVATLANGKTFTVYQKIKGELIAGSDSWLGDRTGTRWLHISSF